MPDEDQRPPDWRAVALVLLAGIAFYMLLGWNMFTVLAGIIGIGGTAVYLVADFRNRRL